MKITPNCKVWFVSLSTELFECIEETFYMWVIDASWSSGLDNVCNEVLFPAASD